MSKYSKFWLSLTGPLATALVAFGVTDTETAQAVAASSASLVGSLFVILGPGNSS